MPPPARRRSPLARRHAPLSNPLPVQDPTRHIIPPRAGHDPSSPGDAHAAAGSASLPGIQICDAYVRIQRTFPFGVGTLFWAESFSWPHCLLLSFVLADSTGAQIKTEDTVSSKISNPNHSFMIIIHSCFFMEIIHSDSGQCRDRVRSPFHRLIVRMLVGFRH